MSAMMSTGSDALSLLSSLAGGESPLGDPVASPTLAPGMSVAGVPLDAGKAVGLPQPVPAEIQKQRKDAEKEQTASMLQGMSGAIDEMFTSNIARQIHQRLYPADPSFKMTEGRLRELSNGLTPDLVERYAAAESDDELRLIQSQNLQLMEGRRALASMGWTGTALTIGASVLDPAYLAVGMATGGMGTAAAVGTRAARLAQLARAGLVAGIPMAAMEAIKSADDPRITNGDIFSAGAGGIGFGLGAAATRTAPLWGRALGAGGGAAVGTALVDTPRTIFDEERSMNDLLFAVGSQFAFGGVAHGLSGLKRAPEAALPRVNAGRRVQWLVQLRDLASAAGKAGEDGSIDVSGSLTPKGKARVLQVIDTDTGELKLMTLVDDAANQLHPADAAALRSMVTSSLAEQASPPVAPSITGAESVVKGRVATDVSVANQDAFFDGLASGTPISAVLYRTGEKMNFDRGAFFGPKEYVSNLANVTGEPVFSRRIDLENPLVFWSKDHYLETLAKNGDEEAASLLADMRAQRAAFTSGSSLDFSAQESFISKKVRDAGHDGWVSQFEIEVVALKPESILPNVDSSVPRVDGGIATAPAPVATTITGPAATLPLGRLATDFDLSGLNDARSSMAKVVRIRFDDTHAVTIGLTRWDMPGMVGQSEVPSIRKLNNAIGPDPLFKADGSPSMFTAPEWVSSTMDSAVAEALTANDAIYGRYVAESRSAGLAAMSREDFFELAAKVKRAGVPAGTNPILREAIQAADARFAKLLELAKRHGVVGAESIEADGSYVPRLTDRGKLNGAIETFGLENVVNTVAAAIEKRQTHLTPEQAKAVAQSWVRKVGLHDDAHEFARDNFLSAETLDELAQVVRDANPGMPPDQLQNLMLSLTRSEANAGVPNPRLKFRVRMDETHVQDFADGRRLAIADLLENNLEVLEATYAHAMVRSSAMAEIYRVMGTADNPITSRAQLMAAVERDAQRSGLKPAEYLGDLKKLDTMLRMTAGIPLSDQDAPAVRVVRFLRNMQFMRLMSGIGSGIQNFGELLPAMQQAGFKAIARQIPTLFQVFKRGADGQLSNELLRELQVMTGLGVERINRRPLPRVADELGNLSTANRLERASVSAARFAADVSMQSVGQTVMQRWVGALLAQRWSDAARGSATIDPRRAAGLGLKAGMAERINTQLRTHATMENGWAGHQLAAVNLQRWTDVEAAAAFRNAITRESRRLIMTNNPAEYAHWMTSETGKVLSQLRTFAFGAWTKKLLYSVQQRDLSTFIHLGVSSAAAAMTYTLRTYLDAQGRQDKDEFLRQRLAPEAIAKASFSRAAYSAMIPMAVDTVVSDIGQRPGVFSYARASGLEGGALMGSPMVDWANRAARSIGSVQALVSDDYEFSKQDVKNLQAGFWVPRMYGVQQIIDQLSRDLPERSIDPRQGR